MIVLLLFADDSDDDILETTSSNSPFLPSQSSKFEIPLLKRDERLFDIRNAIKREEKERENEINRLKKNYTKQHKEYKVMNNDVKKQSNTQLKHSRKKVDKFFEFD